MFYKLTAYTAKEILGSVGIDCEEKDFWRKNPVVIAGLNIFKPDHKIKFQNTGRISFLIGGKRYKIAIKENEE